MIKSVFNLFKIHRKVIFGNAAVIVQHMLRKTPKSLNAVDMILASVGKRLAVVQSVMLPESVQRVVTAKGVRVIHRALSGMLSDMAHQFLGGYLLHYFGVHPAVTLQKAQYNAFPGRSSSSLPLPPASEVRFVNLNLAFQFARLQFGHMVYRFTKLLIYSTHRLVVRAEVACHAIRRLLLIETRNDAYFLPQLFERLLFSTGHVLTTHISAFRPTYLERTAKNALSASQKVGRTVKTIVSTSNHMGILVPAGYFSH